MKNSASNSGKSLVLLAAAFPASPGISEDIHGLEKAAVRIMGEAFVKNNGIKTLITLRDELGSADPGPEGYQPAAVYCSQVFSSYGLTNVHREPFEVNGGLRVWRPRRRWLRFRKNSGSIRLANRATRRPAAIIAEVVDVGYGTEEDFVRSGTGLKGKDRTGRI